MQFTYRTSNWPGHMFFIHLTRSLFTANLLCGAETRPRLQRHVVMPALGGSQDLAQPCHHLRAANSRNSPFFYEESPSCQNIRSACMRMCFSRMFWQSMKDSCEDLMPAKRFSLAFWIGDAQGCLVHCQILNSLRYLTFCWPGTWFVSDMYSY